MSNVVFIAARKSACLLCPCKQFLLHCLISKAQGERHLLFTENDWSEYNIWRRKWINEWVCFLCALWNNNAPFQSIVFSKDEPLLPLWTESQTVTLYVTLLKPRGAAFAFCLHCSSCFSQQMSILRWHVPWHWPFQSETCVVVPHSVHMSLI